MSTSGYTYKEYSFANHKEVYQLLEYVFGQFGVSYYLIGANARDIALYKAGQKPSRATGDIDFAVMLPDISTYQALLKGLTDNGFTSRKEQEGYRVYHKETNTLIDLLPYGGIARNKLVNFPGTGLELSAVGLKEVGEEAQQFSHPEGFSIPVSPAHGVVILKLVAWSERPDRAKDLKDIKDLLDAAWNLYEEELFQEDSLYADLFEEKEFQTQTAASRVMGRKMQAILNLDDDLKQLVIAELEKEVGSSTGPKATQMVAGTDQNIEEIKTIFKALLQGITDDK
jgi:predicted nucleotidyltransferase